LVIEAGVKNGGAPVCRNFTTKAPPPFDIGFVAATARPPSPPTYVFPWPSSARLRPAPSVDPLRYVEYSRFDPDESSAAAKLAVHALHPDVVVPDAVYSGHKPLSRLDSKP
jgi:hypothetical protein